MRVTRSMMYRSALTDLSALRTQMARTQEQASTMQRVNRPSDDPAAAAEIQSLEAQLRGLQQHQRTVSGVRARVNVTESTLRDAADLIGRARELALQGANETHTSEGRAQMALEIEGLYDAMLGLANSRFAGSYLFGGYESSDAPFIRFGPETPLPERIAYAGDPSEIEVEIEEGLRVRTSLDGRRVFHGDADGDGFTEAGREDVFRVLRNLHTALSDDDPVAVRATLDSIDRVFSQLNVEATRIGLVNGELDAAAHRLEGKILDVQLQLRDVGDADFAEVISRSVREEAALRASLEMMNRLMSPTLLDFLG